ncbi:MAG TPA: hypothetical protein DCY06_10490 [Bacteroidetes bacterium]|nr:hypothetical protein [Bacteroidota bacterium]
MVQDIIKKQNEMKTLKLFSTLLLIMVCSKLFSQTDAYYSLEFNANFIPTGFSISPGALHPFSPILGTTLAIPDSSIVSCYIINADMKDSIILFENNVFPGCICQIVWFGKDENKVIVNSGLYKLIVEATLKRRGNLEIYFKAETKLLKP